MKKHTDNSICPECEKKLESAHPYLVGWFHEQKRKYPDLHVAWAYRNKAEQDACIISGSTKAEFPFSPHNKLDLAGNPCSMALDIFQIGKDGVGRWPTKTYMEIDKDNVASGEPIVWGGKFSKGFDGPHFQYNPKANA